ncbi:YjfA family protein [Shimazuella sp. AN120528]|uniref:DUF2690 domain-containing protein n=1 Tax=Shimazuella soli TaxID=1892854 RepID=UPI001F0D7353|nr:DUF2690 domain-containing protein [Shimazuella soli]MCH5585971.1 YjfA family protein [Shimazuella soli]
MNLKKWRVGLLSAAVGVAGLFVGISDTHAANYQFDGKSPVATHCNKTGVAEKTKPFSLKLKNGQKVTGKIYLMYSTKCKTAWSYVKLDKSLPSNMEINGIVKRKNDKKTYSCYSKGGNGMIEPGQRNCYSAMVYDYKPNTSYASATAYSPKGFYNTGKPLDNTDPY